MKKALWSRLIHRSMLTLSVVALGAGTLAVTAGAVVATGSITGTLTFTSSGQSVCVEASYSPGQQYSSSVPLTTSGSYTITNVPYGSYHVRAFDCGGPTVDIPQWYTKTSTGAIQESSAVPVTVASSSTPNINFTMAQGGSISGTVTSSSSKSGIGCLFVSVQGNNGEFQNTFTATSGTVGSYTIGGLAPGKYQVAFGQQATSGSSCTPATGYAPEYYNGAFTQGSATPVTVTGTKAVTNINAVMALGGSLSGTVENDATTPAGLAGICISAVDGQGDQYSTQSSSASGSVGDFAFTSMRAGWYMLQFTNCGAGPGYVQSEYYKNSINRFAAQFVHVTSGGAVTGIKDNMISAVSITGTVDSGSTPLSGICVDASNAQGLNFPSQGPTPTNGSYTINGVPVGMYQVQFTNCGAGPGYVQSEFYLNAVNQTAARHVKVGATPLALSTEDYLPAGSITGTVDSGSTPLSGICINVSDQTLDVFQGAMTQSNGTYAVNGLPPGIYVVQAQPCQSTATYPYVMQFYNHENGIQNQSEATPVRITTSTLNVTGINFSLETSGTISGTVFESNGTTPLAGICVSLTIGPAPTNFGSNGPTSATGTYTITDVPPGNYDVQFNECDGGSTYQQQYWNNSSPPVGAPNSGGAAPVKVTSGATTSNINADMS
ncbi:MAG: MSCRAMM family protein [Acidimicrobiales bacterium]